LRDSEKENKTRRKSENANIHWTSASRIVQQLFETELSPLLVLGCGTADIVACL